MDARKQFISAGASLALLMAFAATCSSCGLLEPEQPGEQKLFVHLQAWFNHTPVEVRLNGDMVFQDTVSTGEILAYAARIPLTTNHRRNRLLVRVDDTVEAETTLVARDSLYVGVNYRKTDGTVTFSARDEPFAYY